MQQEQEKYDPVILNLSKSQAVKQPKSYFWLFLTSLLLLGVLLVSSAWYVLFYPKVPTGNGDNGPGLNAQATVAVAEPTPTPRATATPEATMTPVPEETPDVPTNATREPEPEPLTGYLSLHSIPENADVVIDGKLLGQTPLNKYELAVGDYSVTFEFNGQRFHHEFSIKPGESTEYTHRFEGFASLDIVTTSSGCDVYLNGHFRGKSPLKVEGLLPGEYTLKLEKVGYHTTEEHVTLEKGEKRELFLTIRRLGSRSSSGDTDSPRRVLHPSERLRN